MQIVITIRLNSVPKGDFLAYLTGDGDFWLRPRELAELGILYPPGPGVEIGNELHISLRSIAGAEFQFDQRTLTLDLRIMPDQLPSQVVNLGSTLPTTPVQPRAPGGFLNYRLGYAKADNAPATLNATTELGVAIGELLLLDNHVFNTPSDQAHSVRLQTQLIFDQPDAMRRWVAGDSFASSGELGSSLNLGGLAVSKLYQINPYFIKTPLAGYAGSVAQPSTIDVYVDGVRVRTEQVAPGNFNLQNLSAYSATGLRNVELVVRDPFGREQHIGFPYFFTDQLLAEDLSEYSYNAGVLRNNFGARNSDYGAFAVSAFHRYGFTDRLTLGLGGDASREHINIGPRVTFNTVSMGIIAAAVSVSHDRGEAARSGNAMSLNHTFLAGLFSSQILWRRYSTDYSVIGFDPVAKPKLQAVASISHGTSRAGTYSLAYDTQTVYGGATDRRATTIGFNKTLFGSLSLVLNVSRIEQGARSYLAFIGLAYYPANGVAVSGSHQRDNRGNHASDLQVNKTPPVGEGLGYRLFAERSEAGGTTSESISPFVQYNTRTAILTAESTAFMNGGGGNSRLFQVAAAGAVTLLGNRVHLSRPVDDSYAAVKIEPPLAGVRVMSSNDVAGKTDAEGFVFVPHLGSYQVNDVAIQGKDLPLDALAATTTRHIRPPYRSGALVVFPVKRVRAVVGNLKLRKAGAVRALENVRFTLDGAAAKVAVSTVRNGDFYVENLPAGAYSVFLQVGTESCRVTLTVPDVREIVTNLGDIFCETTP